MATENERQLFIETFLIHLILEAQYYFPFITVSYTPCSIKFYKNSWSHNIIKNGLYIHVNVQYYHRYSSLLWGKNINFY